MDAQGATLVNTVSADFKDTIASRIVQGGTINMTLGLSDNSTIDMTYGVEGAVASVDGVYYGSLPAAFAEAENKDSADNAVTIELARDATSIGISVPSGSNIILDFNGFTLTSTGGAGSSGTETQAFQLLKDSTIVFKNGTLTGVPSNECQMLIQNYSNLTLDNMMLNAVSSVTYALSSNNGEVILTNGTIINAYSGKTAVDVMYWPALGYAKSTITIEDATINGKVEYGTGGTTESDKGFAEYLALTVNGGRINGAISFYYAVTAQTAVVTVNGGTFSNPIWLDYLGENADVNLVLDSDVTRSITIPAGVTVDVDLNGSTLTNTNGSHTITNNGTLTVTDSSDEKDGAVDNTTHGKAALYNAVGATAILNGGTFERSTEAGVDSGNNGGNSYYTIQNQGTMTVNDGVSVENNGKFSSAFANGWLKGTTAPFVSGDSGERVTANLTINGGTFKGGLNTIKNDDLGVLTINGGLFTNYAQNAFMNAHIAVVNDGVFDANTEFSIYCYGADPDDGVNEYIGGGKLTLNGGFFSGGIHMMGGSTLATDQDGIAMVSGNSITLEVGAKLDGAFAGPDGNAITITGFTASSKTTITAGSFVIDGSWIGSMTVSGDDIVVTGTLNEGANITVKPQADGTPTNITWRDFDQNGANITYQDAGGAPVEDPSTVANEYYSGMTTLGGVTITVDEDRSYTGLPMGSPGIIVIITGGAGTQAYLAEATADDYDLEYEGAYYRWVQSVSESTIFGQDGAVIGTTVTDAGTYVTKYVYYVDNQPTVIDISWSILPVDAEITFEDIDKTYDGTTALGPGDSVTTPDVPNVMFGTPVYEDMNAGEDKTVILAVEFQNGAVPGNYAFTVNGQDAQIQGDAESGYYIELQGTISKKEITLTFSTEMEYSGEVFEHAFSLADVTGVDGDIIMGKMTTSGSDANEYSGAGINYNDIVIMNGETDVTSNYVITYSSDNKMTIDPKDVTVSPAENAEITKVYNGYSSRIMEDTDFQMTGVIDGDDVSFTWTNSATYVKYNSSNVSKAETLTVTGISLTGDDAANYELTSDEVVFEDGVDGITVGITPLVLSFTGKDAASVDKTYNGTVVAPVEDITSDDYTVSQSQSGTQPTVSVTSAVYDSADAGTGKTVYITGIELSNNDNGNFALPEMQTSGDVQYYFSITGDGVKIVALALTSDMIGYEIAEVDGQIVLTLTVSYEELVPTGFTSTLKLDETDVTGTNNSYPISSAGTYTATVTPTDTNWSGTGVSKTITIEFTYVANFYTKKTIDGAYSIEQTVTGDKQIQTPNATNVPAGYVLAGWALEPNGSKAYGVNVFADVSPVNTDFYAVYEEDSGTPVGPEPGAEPQVTIDMPSEFVLGEQTEFSVSTVANGYSGNVKGTGVFEGIRGVDYVIQYYEIQDGQWYDWTSGEFGPSDGFPMADDTSKFRVTFLNAGTYALTVQIVTADTGEVVCETTTTVEVVAAHSLDYYINAALGYQYTGESEYEYKGDLSYDSGDIVAVYGPEYGEILQEIIGMIESGDTSGAKSKIGELKDIKYDYVRYMGALHWQGTGVSSVAWNGTTYTWDDSLTTKGSRWTSESGTLSADINTYIIGQYLAGNFTLQISMELSNGAEREMFTYSVQFEEAPAPEVQYFDVTLSGEGVAFYIDGLRYDAGTYAFAEGEHRISIEVLNGYEGTPSTSNVEDGMFTVSGEMTIEVTGISAVEVPVEAPYLSVVLPGVVYVGDEIDFSVTSNGQYSNNVFSKYETDAADGTYTVWYIENAGSLAGQPVELGNGDLFGPQNTGYPYTDGATSSFRVVFNAPGTYVFTISVVDADDTSEVVCSKMMYITVVSAPVVAESFDVVIGSETAIVRSEGQSVGLPSVYEGRPVSGWQVGDKTYSGVYVVDATDAVDGTITLTPVYEGDEYDVAVTLTDTEHASHSGVVKSGDVFYITVETDVGYSITGYTASQGDFDLPIAVVASYGHTVTLMVTVSGYEDVTVNIVVEQNAVSENIDVTIESHMDGAYITIDANSDYAYLPTNGTITVTYYWSVIGTDGFVTMSSETTTAQVVTTDGETGLTHLIVELGDEASYGDSADAGHYLNGDAYAIVAQYQYGETTVVSNTETEVYVS